MAQESLYKAVLNTLHLRKDGVSILDFGCGERGVGRVIIEGIMNARDQLHLYDSLPEKICPPRNGQGVNIASRENIFGDRRTSYDLINISYVLCMLEPEEAKGILEELRTAHPEALFTIVDYTLNNRTDLDIPNLLSSNEEMKWQQNIGVDEFIRTHTRFTRQSLCALVQSAGLHPMNGRAAALDEDGIRSAIVTYGRNGKRRQNLYN